MQYTIVALLALGTALGVALPAATAQPTLAVSPAASAVEAVGETFTVDVTIADYADLRGFSVELLYNQAALRHTAVTAGDVFSRAGEPGGIFLSSGSDAGQGYVLAEGARIGGGGSAGAGGRLFRVTFESVGPGASDLYFGQVLLRDATNAPIDYRTLGGVVAVISPLPDDSHTRAYGPTDVDTAYVALGSTGLSVRVASAGAAARGKLTAARYDTDPPGAAPLDGTPEALALAGAYWELTSSLAGTVALGLGFSYDGLVGPSDPGSYRVVWRPLAASGEEWAVVPAALTSLDPEARKVRVEGWEGASGSGQYALAYPASTSVQGGPGGLPLPLVLDPPYPNPFGERVVLRYDLGREGRVRLAVYDLLGRPVAVVADGPRAAGRHEEVLAAGDLPAGGYVIRLEAGGESRSRLLTKAH